MRIFSHQKTYLKNLFFIIFFFTAIFFIFLCKTNIYAQENKNKAYKVKINFELNDEAKYYEILWLTKDIDINNYEKIPAKSYIETIRHSPFIAVIDENIKYFKIRSVYSSDIYGAWSKTYSINLSILKEEALSKTPKDSSQFSSETADFFQVLNVRGQKKMFLKTDTLPLEKITKLKEFYFSLNKSSLSRYEKPLNLQSSGRYKLDIYDLNKNLISSFEFWIDKKPPQTFLGIYPPFYSANNILYLGKKSYIELKAADPYSGIQNIFYRIYPVGSHPPSFEEAREKIVIRNTTEEIETDFILEYYSIDFMNNKEDIGIAYFFIDIKPPRLLSFFPASEDTILLKIKDSNMPVFCKIFYENKLYYKNYIFESTIMKKTIDIPLKGDIKIELIDQTGNKNLFFERIP
ncbi:MAG: hypothetical protein OEZ22_06910 [Spirochaetia bacterium]|nr:hypothetical protein [Spirochaetia bacterium]